MPPLRLAREQSRMVFFNPARLHNGWHGQSIVYNVNAVKTHFVPPRSPSPWRHIGRVLSSARKFPRHNFRRKVGSNFVSILRARLCIADGNQPGMDDQYDNIKNRSYSLNYFLRHSSPALLLHSLPCQ
jgi:hypothetical protein